MRRRSAGVFALGQPAFRLSAMLSDGLLARSATDVLGQEPTVATGGFKVTHLGWIRRPSSQISQVRTPGFFPRRTAAG